jgi:hypothetical protein
MAAETDKFRKLARRWVGQIGAGGVSDASVTTIPLSSSTNLPTDTGVTIVIDRVDANGESGATQAAKEETIVGVVSGSNIVSALRGVEGTAQAHDAGAVVEVLVTSDGYNDIIDGILVAHNQDGTHKTLPSPVLTTPQINDTSADHQYVFAVSELTADRTVTLPLLTAGDTFTFAAFIQTLTNKRITKRVYSTTSVSTLTPEIATYDEFALTAQASALTIANHSTSTPADGDKMLITITPDATPRAFTFGDKYVAKAGVALPTTTTASKTMVMGFRWDAGLAKWNLLALGTES